MKPQRLELLLSAYASTRGYVQADLMRLSAEIREDDICLHALYAGLVTEEKAELIECMATEILAEVSPYYNVTTKVNGHLAGEKMPSLPGDMIFERFEGWS